MAQQHELEILRMLEDVVSAEKKDAEHIIKYFRECRGLGIEILPPDINLSDVSCAYEREDALRLGFSTLDCREEKFLEDLLNERQRNGPFQSFQDFCERIELETLPQSFLAHSIKAGIFDSLGDSRARLFKGFERVIQSVRNAKAEKAANQISLFAMLPAASQGQALFISLPEAEAWSEEQRIEYEKEVLGFSFTEYLGQNEEELPEIPEGSSAPIDGPIPEDLIEAGPDNEEFAISVDTETAIGDAEALKLEDSGHEIETGKSEISDTERAIGQGAEIIMAEIPAVLPEDEPPSDSVVPDYLEEPPLPSEEFEGAFAQEPSAVGPTSPDEQETPGEVCVQLPVKGTTEAQLLELRALCEKYPGHSPLLLEFIDDSQHATTRVHVHQKYYVRDDEGLRKDIRALFNGVNIIY